MKAKIDESLAIALAGQVAAGLTPGEGQPDRMYGALTSIGLMVRNAADSILVQDVLDMIDKSEVTEHGHGVTRIVAHVEDSDTAS